MEKRMTFTIQGKSPLLTHNPSSMSRPKTGTGKGKKQIPEAEVEAEAGLYIEDGKFCAPGIGIRNGIIGAASDWRPLSGKKKGTLTSTMAHITVEPEMAPILGLDNKPLKEYEIDSRRAVVQRQGIVRSRPKFPQWRVAFDVVYDDDFFADLGEDKIRAMFEGLLDDAGKRFGLGDYRPQKKGWFGVYTVLKSENEKKK